MSNVATLKKPTEDLASLTHAWLTLKQAEADAASARLAVEQRICALLPANAHESTSKGSVEGFAISVRYGVGRKVDSDKLQAMWDGLSDKARECFRWKADIALQKLRGLIDFAPAEYTKLAECIEVVPAKPQIRVEVALEGV